MKLWLVGFLAIAAWAQDRTTWGARPARVISRTEPEYSEEASRAGVNATVVLSLVINERGMPEDVRIERAAGFGLDEKAVESVQAWRFEPGIQEGKPFKSPTKIEINFSQLSKGHENQRASLTFTLPAGAARPELIEGSVPRNPVAGGDARLRIRLTVSPDGQPQNLQILETTDQDWANHALQEMKEWRFREGALQTETPGLFELTVGASKASDDPATAAAAGMVSISPPEVQDHSLSAPKLVSPPDHALFNSYPRRTVCKWEASAGAVSYLLEWDYMYREVWNAEYQGIPGTAFVVNGTEYAFDFIGAQPGRWRVWPVSVNGRRGNPSEWRTFRHLR